MTFRAKAAAVVLALIAALLVFVAFAAVRTWREQSANDLPPSAKMVSAP